MNRFKELDFIRAVSIAAVVALHASIKVLKNTESTAFSQIFCLAVNQLSRFAVPCFLFVSGVLAYYSFEKLKLRELLTKRFFELAVPYLVWSAIGFLMFPTTSLVQLGYVFILGQGAFYQLYYIPLLFQMYLLLPFIKRASSEVLLSVLSAISVLIFIYYQSVHFGFLPGPANVPMQNLIQATFVAWVFYFVSGYIVGKNYTLFASRVDQVSLFSISVVFSVCAGLLLLDCYLSWKITGRLAGPPYDYYRISVFVYSLSSVLLMFKIGRKVRSGAIDNLYRNSFGIYLNHVLVMIGLTRITDRYLFSDSSTTLLGIVLTLAISYIMSMAFRFTVFSKLLLGQESAVQNFKRYKAL